MVWNWQLADWPNFTYTVDALCQKERDFLLSVGTTFAFRKNIHKTEYTQFIVEMLTSEGKESSKIEGELLDRASLQSSIGKHFGLQMQHSQKGQKEFRMARLLCEVYDSFDAPLTHEMLWHWHSLLFDGSSHALECGTYRTHTEPMQIVSNTYGSPRVFFEAPPSKQVPHEMDLFLNWFNHPKSNESLLGRAAVAHVYFESIHPFEDGNGRIGRALIEKILSQGIGRPVALSLSHILEKQKKDYYLSLERCNQTLVISQWVEFFAEVALRAQTEAAALLSFLLEKSRILTKLSGQINERQEKVLLRMFQEGPDGFVGGLSAEKYISITKTSRATATRDLSELVDKGALYKTGELRHTRYWLKLR